ncbi:MAG: LysR substrate-binding domain-containing protein, partial [Paracoccaceae bacterium]|nr:LysR substrate-binding domain-containing protein [Paracoccaceae bacterium]
GDPLAGQTKPSLDELFSRKIILREPGSGTRILAHRFLDQLGRGRTYTTIEMESNETIKQSVMAGLGIALLSAHTLIEELHAGRIALIPLRNLPIIRQWFLLHRQDLRMTGAIEKIRADILADAARMIRLEDVKAALGTV